MEEADARRELVVVNPLGRCFQILEERLDQGRRIAEDIPLLVHARLQEPESLLYVDGGEFIQQRIGPRVAYEGVGDVVVGHIRIDGATALVVLKVVGGDVHRASGSNWGLRATGSTPRSGSPPRQ